MNSLILILLWITGAIAITLCAYFGCNLFAPIREIRVTPLSPLKTKNQKLKTLFAVLLMRLLVFALYALGIALSMLWSFLRRRWDLFHFRLFAAVDCHHCHRRLRKPLLWLGHDSTAGIRTPRISHTFCKPCWDQHVAPFLADAPTLSRSDAFTQGAVGQIQAPIPSGTFHSGAQAKPVQRVSAVARAVRSRALANLLKH